MMIRTNVDESFPMIRPYSSASRMKRPVHQECPATSLTLQSSHPSQEVMLPVSLHSQVLPHQHFSRVAPMNPTTIGVFSTVTSPMISYKQRFTISKSPLMIVRVKRVNSITKLLHLQKPSIMQSKSTWISLIGTGEISEQNLKSMKIHQLLNWTAQKRLGIFRSPRKKRNWQQRKQTCRICSLRSIHLRDNWKN